MKDIYKKVVVFTIFLFSGLYSVLAQDMIIMRNENVIEARILEISPTEIRYKRFNHQDGPTIIILKNDVLRIVYENGNVENFNTATTSTERNQRTQTVTDPDKLVFSISADPSGFLILGPAIDMEFTKRAFNTQVYANFPSLGLLSISDGFSFGIGASFNYFLRSRIGGLYLGGLIGYKYGTSRSYGWYNPNDGDWYIERYDTDYQWREKSVNSSFLLALNGGYKFVLPLGIFFRVGGNIGAEFVTSTVNLVAIPNLSFGYNF